MKESPEEKRLDEMLHSTPAGSRRLHGQPIPRRPYEVIEHDAAELEGAG